MKIGMLVQQHREGLVACLVDADKQFVVRLCSPTAPESEAFPSADEASALARAGLEMATLYRDEGVPAGRLGRARGHADAVAAHRAAMRVGQPPGSAIYFAVDGRCSAGQIRTRVVPYFEGIRAGMEKAGGGHAVYEIGVRGSGPTCKAIKEDHALARFSWLVSAGDAGASEPYQTWDLRQQGTEAVPLDPDTLWETSEARENFGQFQPLGTNGDAPPDSTCVVSASELNLRRVPTTVGNTPIARMPEGQLVHVLGRALDPWVLVRTSMGGNDVVGYASSRYLTPLRAEGAEGAAPAGGVPARIPAVHHHENDPGSRRSATSKRAQPLGEPGQPTRDAGAPAAERVTQLGAIVAWLDAPASPRYQRQDGRTWCNVYAADFCYLAGVYLPRVWWKPSALMEIARSGKAPPVLYGETIDECRAGDLLAWLIEFGPSFGWRRVFDASALQAAANAGGVGIICADNATSGASGHISVVVPETETEHARRDAGGEVVLPLQSAAGAVNYRYGTGGERAWWEAKNLRSYVFFVHE